MSSGPSATWRKSRSPSGTRRDKNASRSRAHRPDRRSPGSPGWPRCGGRTRYTTLPGWPPRDLDHAAHAVRDRGQAAARADAQLLLLELHERGRGYATTGAANAGALTSAAAPRRRGCSSSGTTRISVSPASRIERLLAQRLAHRGLDQVPGQRDLAADVDARRVDALHDRREAAAEVVARLAQRLQRPCPRRRGRAPRSPSPSVRSARPSPDQDGSVPR